MGKIQVFAGKGHGKSPAAWGEAIMAAAAGKRVFIVQFLKGKGMEESSFQRRLEPEIKLFRFEKSTACVIYIIYTTIVFFINAVSKFFFKRSKR